MKNLKFRVFDTKAKEWAEYLDGCIEAERECFGVPRTFLFRKDLKILMSTGLRDKNGEEVFEGDTLIYESCEEKPIPYKVVWKNGGFYWCNFPMGEWLDGKKLCLTRLTS
jgi:hypothetical protein